MSGRLKNKLKIYSKNNKGRINFYIYSIYKYNKNKTNKDEHRKRMGLQKPTKSIYQ